MSISTKSNSSDTIVIPHTWNKLYESEHPIDFDALLQSDLLAAHQKLYNKSSITRQIGGAISTIASSIMIWHILRSHNKLSTSYHRLVFGLAVSDIMSSCAHILCSAMVPQEMKYFAPYAKGNTISCDIQGVLLCFGFSVAALYNCSICFYYLAIIGYNKGDAYIRQRLGPWFHGVSIIVPLVITLIFLVTKSFNTYTTVCFLNPYHPPHCIGCEDGGIPEGLYNIPCGRGNFLEKPLGKIALMFGFLLLW